MTDDELRKLFREYLTTQFAVVRTIGACAPTSFVDEPWAELTGSLFVDFEYTCLGESLDNVTDHDAYFRVLWPTLLATCEAVGERPNYH